MPSPAHSGQGAQLVVVVYAYYFRTKLVSYENDMAVGERRWGVLWGPSTFLIPYTQ